LGRRLKPGRLVLRVNGVEMVAYGVEGAGDGYEVFEVEVLVSCGKGGCQESDERSTSAT